MKKTIVIVILAVYIASIAVVNFFGLEVKVFEGTTYVSSIQCDSITFHGDNSRVITASQYTGKNSDIPLFIFDFIPPADGTSYTSDEDSITSNPNIIEINYEIFPHLADEAGIKFEYDEGAGVVAFHELSSSFVFLKPQMFTLTIKATDGSNVSCQVCILGRVPASQGQPAN
ncbi:MAG: hypothetical protein IJ459_00425 [Clostridia bacterium]|nr:hypothetical protein [Clostridia bacterium]